MPALPLLLAELRNREPSKKYLASELVKDKESKIEQDSKKLRENQEVKVKREVL